VIAIDGPVGAGKSTVARRLADALGCVHIDSGAMYRALGWKALRLGVDLGDHRGLARLAAGTDVRIVAGGSVSRVLVDGEDVTHALRTPAMDEASSIVSTCPGPRTHGGAAAHMARAGAVVMDRRDIGTVVFPSAQLKFFLDADWRCEPIDASRICSGQGHGGAEVIERMARQDARPGAQVALPRARPMPSDRPPLSTPRRSWGDHWEEWPGS
jgi:cytidylate kinase